MPGRNATIVFGRLHREANLFSGDNTALSTDWLESVFAERDSVQFRGYTWRLGGLTPSADGVALAGRLGKVAEIVEELVYWDDDSADFCREQVIARKGTWSNFVVDCKTHGIAYEVRSNKISEKSFRDRFAAVAGGQLAIDPVLDEALALERLRSVQKLHSVSFHLRPTNPLDDSVFRALDGDLKSMRAERATHKYENRGEGLLLDGTMAEQAARMAIAGYGDYHATGESNGNSVQIESHSQEIKEDVEIDEEPSSFLPVFLRRIRERIGI